MFARTNLALDIVIAVAFLVAAPVAGLTVHVVVRLAFGAAIAVHLVLHWSGASTRGRRSSSGGGSSSRTRRSGRRSPPCGGAAVPPPRWLGRTPETRRSTAMRVLVVEDEKKTASFIRKALRGEGFAVDVCHNGDDGLHLAETTPYDALVLDIMLPGPRRPERAPAAARAAQPGAGAAALRARRGQRAGRGPRTPGPTTTCPSRSRWPSSSPASARWGGAATRLAPACCRWPTSRSTRSRAWRGAATRPSS